MNRHPQSKNWFSPIEEAPVFASVIHDLRIECEGRVAQIDHLLIGRFLDIWVCETKNFSEGIAINEQGNARGSTPTEAMA